MTANKIFDEIDLLYPKYLDVLEDVCKIESPTSYKAGVDAVGKYFIDMANARGFKVEVLHEEIAGDAVCITLNPDAKGAPVALSGHIDTVHPVGLFKEPIVHRDDKNMYGPGVMDCKGGVVAAFLTMDALDRCGFRERPVMLIIQSDEEVSSKYSNRRTVKFMCEKAKDAVAFINLEGNIRPSAIIKRKGVLQYKINVHGKAAHSSRCAGPNAANAIAEAAHKILELEKMKDADGLTCNCGVINGGTTPNTVAEECTFMADIRFSLQEEMEKARKTVKDVCENNVIPGCSCDVEELTLHPAMERCEKNLALLDKINEINEKVGLPILATDVSVAGSDAAHTTVAGIPTVDNLGMWGNFIHSTKEYVVMSTLALSAKQQAAIALMI